MNFDHIGFPVSDFPRSRAFYAEALKPLGIGIVSEGDGWALIGGDGRSRLWIGTADYVAGPIHVAFTAATREQVRQFHAAALAAGGQDNGAPGPRPQYSPTYYGAFVIDPDGHNVEAVCHTEADDGALWPSG